MQDYSCTTHFTNELDIKIANKKNQIHKLREEIRQLELDRSKQDTNYVGRIFEMESLEYVYVTGRGFDGEVYGIAFEEFEYSTEIHKGYVFDPSKIEKEIPIEVFKKMLKNMVSYDKIKNLLN